uniref:Glycoprotein n=2 Tax=Viral hemorrhagic septicemia virus TaxID=11287 RepID=C5H4C2_9RHAB|nr:glycoprotein [Viral hemorrhagic septicemia virus]CTQ87821.1 glycoprotein [Viral hemorrhagic septicemia virus]
MEWNTFFLVILIIIIKSTTPQITQRPPVENISTYHADWDTPLYTHPSNCRDDSFVPIRPAQLRCPHEFEDINKGLVSVPTRIIHLPLSVTSVSAVASGHYLHRVTYRVTCSTSFFGGQTIEKTILEAKLSRQEATDEASKDHEYPFFPEPSCIWMKNNVHKDITHYYKTPKTVSVDLYSRKFLNPDFIEGVCTTSPCQTHWQGVYWVGATPKAHCPTSETLEGHLFTRTHDHRVVKAIVAGHHPWGLTMACTVTFCGTEWIKTDLGDLIQVTGPGGTRKLTPNKCVNTDIQMRGATDDFSYLNHLITNMAQRTECLDAHSDITASGKVSSFLLSKFRPRHPGPGKAHYLLDGQIMRGDCDYEAVVSINYNRAQYKTVNNTWKSWKRVDNNTDGYDGMIFGDKLIIPDIEKYQSVYDSGMLVQRNLVEVPHLSIVFVSNTSDLSTNHIHTNLIPSDWSFNWSLWPSLSGMGVVGGAFLLLVLCCCCKASPPIPNYGIPMQQFSRSQTV